LAHPGRRDTENPGRGRRRERPFDCRSYRSLSCRRVTVK
jgi:hypothetical protein